MGGGQSSGHAGVGTGFLTEGLHSLVAGLAAGLTADVIEDEEDVMFLVNVDRQLDLNLCKNQEKKQTNKTRQVWTLTFCLHQRHQRC